jgi:hypothetical protein
MTAYRKKLERAGIKMTQSTPIVIMSPTMKPNRVTGSLGYG